MDTQKLDAEALEILAAVDEGNKAQKASGRLVDRLMPICKDASKMHEKVRGLKFTYEVAQPVTVNCRIAIGRSSQDTTASLIGMEVMRLVRLMPTFKGEIVGIFWSDENPDTEFLIPKKNFEKVFGKAGAMLDSWLDNGCQMKARMEAVFEDEKRKNSKESYESNKAYGSW